MKQLPLVRKNDLIECESNGETLIYDLTINRAFCLNDTSAVVYKACNGLTTFEEFKTQSGLSEEIIFLTLDGLQKNNLLEGRKDYLESFGAVSRREIIKKVGLSSMIMLPLVSTLIAPTAIQAASRCIAPGGASNYSKTAPFGPTSFSDCVNAVNRQCCSGSATRNDLDSRCKCDNGIVGEPSTCAGMYTCNPPV